MFFTMSPVLEVCCTSIASAIAAQIGGAQRIELCGNLFEGGTTPSYGTIELVREKLSIDINVLIRPRGSDFVYSKDEMEIIRRDIDRCKEIGVNGVVIGFLTQDGEIDTLRTKQITEYAIPLSVTFHRAFDMCRDPYKALEQLIEIRVDRILTSGQQNKASDGVELIADLVEKAGDRVIIMPGAGLTPENIKAFHERVQAKEYHSTLSETIESSMRYRQEGVYMGGLSAIPEYSWKQASIDKIQQFIFEFE